MHQTTSLIPALGAQRTQVFHGRSYYDGNDRICIYLCPTNPLADYERIFDCVLPVRKSHSWIWVGQKYLALQPPFNTILIYIFSFQFSDKISLLSEFFPISRRSVIFISIKKHSFFINSLFKSFVHIWHRFRETFSSFLSGAYLLICYLRNSIGKNFISFISFIHVSVFCKI